MRLLRTCVWSTRAILYCRPRTWSTSSVSWASSTGRAGRAIFGRCGEPSGKSVICRFQTKSSRIFPSVVARYLCAESFVVFSSLSWDLGAGSWSVRISGSVVMRLGGRLPLAGPLCPRSSGFSDHPASWSRTLFPRPSGELFSQPSLIAFATEQVPGSTMLAACRCWQQGELLWKDPLVDVPEAEAVFLDPVDRSQRALAAWVLHVAAAPPEVPMPHACVFCGTLLEVGAAAGACRRCRARTTSLERLVSESSSDS